jgi:hypothetical protein
LDMVRVMLGVLDRLAPLDHDAERDGVNEGGLDLDRDALTGAGVMAAATQV